MKLTGSKTESDFREELVRSNAHLRKPEARLHQVLEQHGHSTESAYLLRWVPEESTDIYTVLIEGSYLVSVELDKHDHSVEPVIEKFEMADYQQGLRKMYRIQLAVAQDLSR